MNILIESIEQRELVDKLKNAGHYKLVETLLCNSKVYTKKGRLNKSAACRALGCKTKQLEDALAACREILHKEFDE
jgi:hypothetical protein